MLLALLAQLEQAAASTTMASFPSVDALTDTPWTAITEFATNAQMDNTGTSTSTPQFVPHAQITLLAAHSEMWVLLFAVAILDILLTSTLEFAILAEIPNIMILSKLSASIAQLELHAASMTTAS